MNPAIPIPAASVARRGTNTPSLVSPTQSGDSERLTTNPLADFAQSVENEHWLDDALCAQIDPDLWFPEKGGSTKEAKEICLSCPVRQKCLDYALRNQDAYGVYGGKSPRQRRKMQRRLAA